MLAYVFWHRPREDADVSAYEQALVGFQRSLARNPPAGMRGSNVFRVDEIPWLATAAFGDAGSGGYEDWYVVDDFAALGVLNEAAVGRSHRTSHDDAAHRLGAGAAGLYRLLEGEATSTASLGATSSATWIAKPVGSSQSAAGELLGDGMDRSAASLWQRQLVFGPAPDFCLLAAEPPPGVATARLPADWTARTQRREALWRG